MTLHTGHLYAMALASLVAFFFISCRDVVDEPVPVGKGLVMVSLNSDIMLKSGDLMSTEDYSDYNVRFVGVGGYATSDYYRYGDMEWPMEWYFGTFRLQAESSTVDEADAGYGFLRYEGLGLPFDVINGQIAQAKVTCTVANIRVNVNFDDKMFLSFKDFKLSVTSVLAPVYEEDEGGELVLVSDEQNVRSLDFNALNKTGYYSLMDAPMHLKYVLYVMLDGADEFIEYKTGYFVDSQSQTSVITRGDNITFNVSYVGEVLVTEDIKFIVEGERKSMSNGFELDDYIGGSVKEDN